MMNQMNNQMMQFGQMSQPQLLQFINIVSFQVVDSQLYLDSHPIDEEAMKHFNYYRELRNNALKAYEKMYYVIVSVNFNNWMHVFSKRFSPSHT